MRSNDQVFYDLVLVCRDGEKIRFANGLHGDWSAQGAIHAIEEAMGRTKQQVPDTPGRSIGLDTISER